MKLPSKELLSEVLGNSISSVKDYNEAEKRPSFSRNGDIVFFSRYIAKWDSVNVYEFAHKCKEWAIKIDYKIESHIHFINKRIIGVASFNTKDNTTKFFQADTEPEAIFKACEYIMEQTKCGS